MDHQLHKQSIFTYTTMNCKNCLTLSMGSGKIITVIALQKPVRPATGGEPAGAPLFTLRRKFAYDQDFYEL